MPREFIPPEELEAVAQRFLREQHPTEELPIPIEEIVEFNLGLDIVPLPNLYRDFRIEGWLSHDGRAIYIDERQCTEMETRYRFSLAHEVSHLLLHADLYRGVRLKSFEDWIAFQDSFDPQVRDSLEWQARSLAGRILVPTAPLVREAQAVLELVKDRLPKDVKVELLFGRLAIPLADMFNVHEEVVRIRLSGDRIGEKLRLR